MCLMDNLLDYQLGGHTIPPSFLLCFSSRDHWILIREVALSQADYWTTTTSAQPGSRHAPGMRSAQMRVSEPSHK